MLRTLLAAAALAVAAVGLAAPASAYEGGCYTDSYGNCSYAPLSLATVLPSAADRAAYGTTPDQHFAYLVTHDDGAPEFMITDFALLKRNALAVCQTQTNGMRGIDVIYALQRATGWSFDVANSIHAAAITIYCPWNTPPMPPPPPPPPSPLLESPVGD